MLGGAINVIIAAASAVLAATSAVVAATDAAFFVGARYPAGVVRWSSRTTSGLFASGPFASGLFGGGSPASGFFGGGLLGSLFTVGIFGSGLFGGGLLAVGYFGGLFGGCLFLQWSGRQGFASYAVSVVVQPVRVAQIRVEDRLRVLLILKVGQAVEVLSHGSGYKTSVATIYSTVRYSSLLILFSSNRFGERVAFLIFLVDCTNVRQSRPQGQSSPGPMKSRPCTPSCIRALAWS